jgi:hypothetical protein
MFDRAKVSRSRRRRVASPMAPPTEPTIYRCSACGNKTRFDVFETKSVRAFYHFTLGGELTVEEEEVTRRDVERVVCRWCGSTDVAEEVAVGSEGSSES